MRKSIRTISRIGTSILIWCLIVAILVVVSIDAIGLFDIPSLSAITTALGALGALLLAWVTVRTVRQNENLIAQQEAQLRPKVRRISDFSTGEDTQNHLVFELENVGSGKAMSMKIISELYILGDSPPQSLLVYTNQSDEVPTSRNSSYPLVPLNKDTVGYPHGGGVLESGKTGSFTFRLSWRNLDADPGPYDPDSSKEPRQLVFGRMLRLLKQSEVKEIGFQFRLTYEDILGNEYEEEFLGPHCTIADVESLSDVISKRLWLIEI